VSILVIERPYGEAALGGRTGSCARLRTAKGRGILRTCKGLMDGKWLILLVLSAMAAAPGITQETSINEQATAATDAARAARRANLPPRVVQAEQFLAQRGWNRDRARGSTSGGGAAAWARAGNIRRSAPQSAAAEPKTSETGMAQAMGQGQGTATWLPLGPTAVQSPNFGLVTGRISALALDPSDTTGNTLYVGTTGGGVWRSQNVDTSSPANISFIPLTDNAAGMGGAAGLPSALER